MRVGVCALLLGVVALSATIAASVVESRMRWLTPSLPSLGGGGSSEPMHQAWSVSLKKRNWSIDEHW